VRVSSWNVANGGNGCSWNVQTGTVRLWNGEFDAVAARVSNEVFYAG